uniref:DUF4200 domain-containing protein n=1 Tax=Echeneis naucrates TaxID=173247 RepID=A0A665X4L1_ECHNA
MFVDMRRRKRETRQSPFKVPDSNSIFVLSVNEKERQKEVGVCLSTIVKHYKRQQTQFNLHGTEKGSDGGKFFFLQFTTVSCISPYTANASITELGSSSIISNGHSFSLQLSILTKRDEILRMDKAVTKQQSQVKQLERMIARDNLIFEEFLRENEKKSVEARLFETAKLEEILMDYKRYKELLFKLSPPEWQEAQKAKALKAKVLSDKDMQNKQKLKPQVSAFTNGKYSSLFLFSQLTLCQSCSTFCVTSLQDEPELYFSDPQQLLDVMTELTEQNLSLIQNTTRVEVTMEGLRKSVETTRKKIETVEEKLNLKIKEITKKIDKERARNNKLRQHVQLHLSLDIEDQDVMLDALSEKVSEVHRCCVDGRVTNLSTLEKLANIEERTALVLQGLESLPEHILETIKRIKDSERRARCALEEREEKQREQREKQKERMRKYMERSLADSKKTVSRLLHHSLMQPFILPLPLNTETEIIFFQSGRKLMPRCMPVAPKVKVINIDNIPAEDELHAYLFTSEDTE